METITLTIDAELAMEYIQHYRAFSAHPMTEAMDDVSLLQAFVHDRLREEMEFIARETE